MRCFLALLSVLLVAAAASAQHCRPRVIVSQAYHAPVIHHAPIVKKVVHHDYAHYEDVVVHHQKAYFSVSDAVILKDAVTLQVYRDLGLLPSAATLRERVGASGEGLVPTRPGTGTRPTPTTPGPVGFVPEKLKAVVEKKCISCHLSATTGNGGVDLSDLAAVGREIRLSSLDQIDDGAMPKNRKSDAELVSDEEKLLFREWARSFKAAARK